MRSGKFHSTGEVAAILDISRSTVTRMFDRGTLTGRGNPVTGERLISEDSLKKFIRDNNLPVDITAFSQRRVVLCSPDASLSKDVSTFCLKDKRIVLRHITQGIDALITCLKFTVDLLILDDSIEDIGSSQVILTLRRQESQQKLRVLVLRRSAEALNLAVKGADIVLPAAPSPDLAQLGCAIYELLDITPGSPAKEEPVPHRRRWRRMPLDLAARIHLRPAGNMDMNYSGNAVLRNVSKGGAFLSGIAMDEGTIPAVPFLMTVHVDQPPLGDWEAQCRPLRLEGNGNLSAGVAFTSISDANRQRIELLEGTEQWR